MNQHIQLHNYSEEARQILPPEAYTSQAWYDKEKDSLFAKNWSFAGMADEVPEVGDYKCVQVGNYPLFILRDKTGDIKAFHNICRHRGTQFMEGKGNTGSGPMCPYHRWSYNMDGSLRGVPKPELFPGLDKCSLSLMPAAVGVFRGLVFVHVEPEPAEPFEQYLAELEQKIGPHDPSQMIDAGTVRYEFESNWKMVCENYMDAYHLFFIHENTAKGHDHDQFQWQGTGRHFLFYEPSVKDLYANRDVGGVPRVPGTEEEDYGGTFHMLFPNLGWVGMPYSWSTFRAIPVSVNRTIVEIHMRVMPMPEEQQAEFMKQRQAYRPSALEHPDKVITLADCEGDPLESDDIMFEDMWACRQMQKALYSPAFNVGAMANKFESTMTFYQKNLNDFSPDL